MIHLCLLAAGNSRRFGSNKLLFPFQGKPLWTYGYEVLKACCIPGEIQLHVVTQYPEILEEAGSTGIFSEDSEKGLSFSIRAVCQACAPVSANDKLLFLAGDQPFISVDTVKQVLAVSLSVEEQDGKPMAACVFDGERTGNPVCFSGLCWPSLMALSGDRGGKFLFQSFPNRIAYVSCQPEEFKDIDLPSDV